MKMSFIFIPTFVYFSVMYTLVNNICVETDATLDMPHLHGKSMTSSNISHHLHILARRYANLEKQKKHLLIVIRNMLNQTDIENERSILLAELDKYALKDRNYKRKSLERNNVKPKYSYNCSNIHKISLKQKVGHGVTKQVFLGVYQQKSIAVKMVTRHQKDVRNCRENLQTNETDKRRQCFIFPNMKLMKEILLLEQMDHPGLIELLGYCVRSEETDSTDLSEHGITAVYEYGRRLNVANLQYNTFGNRLHHAIDLADLLSYLENSPLGSLRVRDFKEDHFLMVNNTIKMIDFDDVDNLEPSCDIYYDTEGVEFAKDTGVRTTSCEFDLQCNMGLCIGFNAKHNLKMMNKIFFSRLLHPKLYPNVVNDRLCNLLARLDTLTITAEEVREDLKEIRNILIRRYGRQS